MLGLLKKDACSRQGQIGGESSTQEGVQFDRWGGLWVED